MSNSTESTISSYFTGTTIIGGQAYIDNNNDGIKDNTITSTNAASTIESAVTNLFNNQLRMISVSLYTCNSSLDTEGMKLATSKLSSTGMFSFANLISGDYYISATLPQESEGSEEEDDVMYKFSSEWIGNSNASSLSIARDASTGGRSEKNENVFNNRNRRRRLGTGGVVNTASDISTINPETGRTNCFTIKDGERVMTYNFGLYPSSTLDDNIEVPPKNAIYYNGFESDDFTSDPLWSTSSWYNDSNLVWTVSQDYPNNGSYALQSPLLDTNEMRISKSSNVTLMLPDYYPYNDSGTNSGQGGTLYFSVLASVQMPFDIFEYYVDNIKRGQLGQTTASNTYQQEEIKLAPGSHEIKFLYHFNPDEVPANFFPNSSLFDDVRFGLVAIDDLYFVPDWDYVDIPVQQPTASPIQLSTKMPTQADTDTSVQPTICQFHHPCHLLSRHRPRL